MTREERVDWLCRLRADLNNGVIFTPWNKEFTEALNEVLEQEPCENRMKHVQETVNTVMNSCTSNSIKDKCFRNAARFIQNAVDGSDPNFEEIEEAEPCQCMDFPDTFEKFVENYGFKDTDERYTNGSELIPVFRVRQWLDHIMPCEDAVRREAVMQTLYDYGCESEIQDAISKLPSVTPKPLDSVLDEIREKIVDKAESGQWSEAVKYGMLKAILIIDKYKAESGASE